MRTLQVEWRLLVLAWTAATACSGQGDCDLIGCSNGATLTGIVGPEARHVSICREEACSTADLRLDAPAGAHACSDLAGSIMGRACAGPPGNEFEIQIYLEQTASASRRTDAFLITFSDAAGDVIATENVRVNYGRSEIGGTGDCGYCYWGASEW